MNGKKLGFILAMILLIGIGCDEGINDYNSSAKVSGYVLNSTGDPSGVSGVQVIIESDVDSDNPYNGPDRWFTTNNEGYFEGYVFLGRDVDANFEDYDYIGDLSVGYFHEGNGFSWSGGITVAPGSHFTLPTVYLTQFAPVLPGGGD